MTAVLQSAIRATFAVAVAVSAACTVHGTDVPALAGPSETALALEMIVSPDSLVQDGRSQASITVTTFDPSGKGKSGQSFRLDTEMQTSSGGWAFQDFGLLSTRTLITGSDGKATAVYTAPAPATSIYGYLGRSVRIVATPVGSNYVAANPRVAELRLVPPAGYQAPGTNPTPSFVVSPTPVQVSVPAFFNASASCPETHADDEPCNSPLSIARFDWDFGDGTGDSGVVVAHAFPAAGKYTVTLRVTNSQGLQALLQREVEVTFPEPPKAIFVVTPAPYRAGVPLTFNASQSTVAAGRSIVQYIWAFGDGTGGSGLTTQHAFAAAGTYNAILTVVDDSGQRGSATVSVTVVP